MSTPISIVIPALDDAALLERNLPALARELERRACGDEIVVVDDTGRSVLEPWLREHCPAARVLSLERNHGFARALDAGVRAARHALVFAMNPDVRVRPGFIEPLVERIAHPDLFAVVPRILLAGDEARVESWTRLVLRNGRVHADQPGLSGFDSGEPRDVAFAILGACLLRRDAFVAAGGCDPLFEPFYFEDLDLCWRAWRAGLRVACEPASEVEHGHRGSIGAIAGEALVLAAIEKNRVLFEWKHLDDPRLLREHLIELHALALDALLGGDRRPLIWLAAALEQLDQALNARRAEPAAVAGFETLARRSDCLSGGR